LSDPAAVLHGRRRPQWSLRAPSRRSRLVEASTAVADECHCGSRAVGVLRGFGHARRSEATALRRRLSSQGAETDDLPAAIAASAFTAASAQSERPRHVCVYIDASGDQSLDAERVAALAGVPIVRASARGQDAQALPRFEEMPALRTSFDHRDESSMFPSVIGHVPDVAFAEVRVMPNQPETGQLRITVGEELPRVLDRGTELVVSPLPGLARIQARTAQGDSRTWMTPEVRVEQVSGIHTVHRDGLCFADLEGVLSIASLEPALRRYTV
jgi:hypothetical protein